MGKVMSRINKQFYRFNAENRALREISKEKTIPAPRHPSTEKAMEKLLEESQHIKEQASIKDPSLDDYLKKVYVVSHDPVIEKRKKPSEKLQLPLNREPPQETELGYFEPHVIPKGKATLFQTMKFLADHQEDPVVYNVSRISSDYSLSKKDTKNILEYFSSFKVYVKDIDPKQVESSKDKLLKYFGDVQKPALLQDKPKNQSSKDDG